MIFLIECGIRYNFTYLEGKVLKAGKQKIIDYLSMRYYGCSEQVHHGEICLLNMEIGKTLIEDFVVGEIEMFGKDYWSK